MYEFSSVAQITQWGQFQTNRLRLSRKINAVYSDNQMKHKHKVQANCKVIRCEVMWYVYQPFGFKLYFAVYFSVRNKTGVF